MEPELQKIEAGICRMFPCIHTCLLSKSVNYRDYLRRQDTRHAKNYPLPLVAH